MIDQPHEEKPALTVVIQSWWTPALAVIMLVVGLLVGYFGRPLLNKGSDTAGDVAAVTTPIVTATVDQAAVPTTSADQPAVPTIAVDPTLAAINSQEQFMAYLVSKTLHFQGDASAPVTIIEFSDYQ
jgi:hypothetical protein